MHVAWAQQKQNASWKFAGEIYLSKKELPYAQSFSEWCVLLRIIYFDFFDRAITDKYVSNTVDGSNRDYALDCYFCRGCSWELHRNCCFSGDSVHQLWNIAFRGHSIEQHSGCTQSSFNDVIGRSKKRWAVARHRIITYCPRRPCQASCGINDSRWL